MELAKRESTLLYISQKHFSGFAGNDNDLERNQTTGAGCDLLS